MIYCASEQKCGEWRRIQPVLFLWSTRQPPPPRNRTLSQTPTLPAPPPPRSRTRPPPPHNGTLPESRAPPPPPLPTPKCTKPKEWHMGTRSASRIGRVINMGSILRNPIQEHLPSQDVQSGTPIRNTFLISNMFLNIVLGRSSGSATPGGGGFLRNPIPWGVLKTPPLF